MNRKFKCEICEKIFSKDCNLREHKKWKHNENSSTATEEQFKCTLCDKTYPKRVNLKNHMHIKHGRGIGKKHALKNMTSSLYILAAFGGSTGSNIIAPVMQFHEIFVTKIIN